MTLPEALKFTYDDYALMPDDRRYEVIDGELVGMPSQTPFHQTVLSRVTRQLVDFVEPRGLGVVVLGPCDVVLSKYDVLQPDTLFVSNERRPILGEKFVGPAPDLVAEVLLPESEARDRGPKAKRYATFGVGEMWLVDPVAKTVEVLVNSEDGFRREALYGESDTVRSVVLPGLEFAAAPVFRPI